MSQHIKTLSAAERKANDMRAANPREPVYPVSKDAEPVTPASGAVEMGAPATPLVEPPDVVVIAAPPNPGRPEPGMFDVVLKHGWVPPEGGAKLKAGTRQTVRIEDARYLIEAGIAVDADQLEAGTIKG